MDGEVGFRYVDLEMLILKSCSQDQHLLGGYSEWGIRHSGPGGLARHLDDRAPVPAFVLDALNELVRRTELVEDDLDDAHSGAAVLWTYRTDADYRADDPDSMWPASWHRAITARLAHDRHRDAAIRYRRPEAGDREL